MLKPQQKITLFFLKKWRPITSRQFLKLCNYYLLINADVRICIHSISGLRTPPLTAGPGV